MILINSRLIPTWSGVNDPWIFRLSPIIFADQIVKVFDSSTNVSVLSGLSKEQRISFSLFFFRISGVIKLKRTKHLIHQMTSSEAVVPTERSPLPREITYPSTITFHPVKWNSYPLPPPLHPHSFTLIRNFFCNSNYTGGMRGVIYS